MSGNFYTVEYFEETNKMINCKIKSSLRKIHKLKRENLVLSDRRKSILRYKSRYNNSSIHTYNECELRRLFKISERIGKNGNKIQRLRTKISQLKKSLTPVVDE
jgi:hypothetical protein